MNPSTALATVLVDELVLCGVREAVLCPGSRSAPLAMALHAADVVGRIRLHVRIDERTAGFLALGLARGSGHPVVVATTSGTAVANLHPAVLEAHYGGVALLVLSADRPPRLRGVGANQTIDQLRVFDSGVLRFQDEFAVPATISGQNGEWRSRVCRALAAARGASDGDHGRDSRPGPAHLNVPFEVPLVPGENFPGYESVCEEVVSDAATGDWPEALSGRHGAWIDPRIDPQFNDSVIPRPVPHDDDPHAGDAPVATPQPGERCLFVADLTNSTGVDLGQLAAAGHPVVSEAGGLGGAGVLAAGVHLLADARFMQAHRPDRVIVLGRPTLYRQVSELLTRSDVTIDMVVGPEGEADVAGTARHMAPRLQAGSRTTTARDDVAIASVVARESAPARAREAAPKDWTDAWQAADSAARTALARVTLGGPALFGLTRGATKPASLAPLTSAAVTAALTKMLPDGATLVLGSSQPPRDVGQFSAAHAGVRVIANRGVAGIDGTVSTAIGVALAAAAPRGESADDVTADVAGRATGDANGPCFALMGDLTFLHDITGLAMGPNEPRPDLTIVVVNNDGGGIFSTLEQGAPDYATSFERVFGTPIGADLGQLAVGFGSTFQRTTTIAELTAALRSPSSGIRVLEVPVTRADLRGFAASVSNAVGSALGAM